MKRSIAVGKFDALHLGHRALAASAAARGRPALLGFSGMAEAFGWHERLPVVADADRARVLALWSERLGTPIELLDLPFATVRDLDAGGFLRLLNQRFDAGTLVCGPDFRCGRDRSAGAADLARLGATCGVAVEMVSPVRRGGAVVSSTRVRDLLAAGAVSVVAGMLGRWHLLLGTVGQGDRRGRTLGFPTANLHPWRNQPPGIGIYAAWAHLSGGASLPAAVSVGHAPTVGEGRPLSVEAHLIGWSGDCYGQELGLEFVERLRGERRFASLEALMAQMAEDVAQVRAILAAHPPGSAPDGDV